MKAFYCHNACLEASEIIFAETRGKARWQFIQSQCDGEMWGVTCTRMKRLDHYGSAANIPFKELIWEGWWTECYHCGMHMDESNLYDEGKDVGSVIGNYHGKIYCCPDCELEHLATQEAKDNFEAQIIREMLWKLEDRLPGAQIELVKPYTYTDPYRKVIYDARLNLAVDGYSVEYRTPTREEGTMEELKRKKLILHIHQNDFPHFEEKYSLTQILPEHM